MTENEFLLIDRITKIKSVNEQLNLLENAYISFSGGKDSTVLHYLIDMALPNNKIPRVYMNTGLEYKFVIDFVNEIAANDERFIILQNHRNIRDILETYGYPCKSKVHSTKVDTFNKGSNTEKLWKYIKGEDVIKYSNKKCNKKLKHHFEERGKYNYSDKCCTFMKKKPISKWKSENKKSVTITGMRRDEGGRREFIQCVSNNKDKFNPLAVVLNEWEQWFVDEFRIKLCKLYYPPFNFWRTGCVGCPFAMKIQDELNKMAVLLPEERKRCELLWGDVYDDYREHNYRLSREKPIHYREKHSFKNEKINTKE